MMLWHKDPQVIVQQPFETHFRMYDLATDKGEIGPTLDQRVDEIAVHPLQKHDTHPGVAAPEPGDDRRHDAGRKRRRNQNSGLAGFKRGLGTKGRDQPGNPVNETLGGCSQPFSGLGRLNPAGGPVKQPDAQGFFQPTQPDRH